MQLSVVLSSVLLLAAVSVACGDDGDETGPEAQPAPAATEFEQGLFDQVPQYPNSEVLQPPAESGDDAARAATYVVENATPEMILDFYVDELTATGWDNVGPPAPVGPDSWRGDWVKDGQRLEVSAGLAPTAESDEPRSTAVQYSLVLLPDEGDARDTAGEDGAQQEGAQR